MYKVLEIDVDSPVGDEPMGTKRKFWLIYPDGRRWLFKYARVNDGIVTGEDWSEKIACELAALIDLPAAAVELAKCQDQRGIVTFDFTREYSVPDEHREGTRNWTEIGQLVHGNELLLDLVDRHYPAEQTYHVPDHTVDRVFGILERSGVLPPPDPDGRFPGLSAADVFVGYLLLDAWIGNTDRHHENWAVIDLHDEPSQRLSPTYDHASSLGRELQEQEHLDRITTRDRNRSVEAYLKKTGARSALYRNTNDKKPMYPYEAFQLAAARRPEAGKFWRGKLAQVDPDAWRAVIVQIPDSHMTEAARNFVDKMLGLTYNQIVAEEASTS